jgi:hypothetical protein
MTKAEKLKTNRIKAILVTHGLASKEDFNNMSYDETITWATSECSLAEDIHKSLSKVLG